MTTPSVRDQGVGRWASVLWRRLWPGGPTRWRDVPRRVRPPAAQTARLTTAGVLAYLLTVALTEGAIDLTGALTAILVCQASALSTVRMGLVRVGAVVTGVLVAVGVSTIVGLTWWSLAVVIGASLLLAKVFRLGDQALETPISAMLILSAGGQEIAAETRLVTTLIGAAVGVGLNVVVPPAIPTRAAAGAVRTVAARLAECVDTMARSLELAPLMRADVENWLDACRAVSADVARASRLVQDVKDARKLNPRALGTRTAEPPLRTGLDRLEQCQLAIRSLLLLMVESAPVRFTRDDGYGEEVRVAFSVVLADVADTLRAFGELVALEACGGAEEVEPHLEQTLATLGETRAVLVELMMVDASETDRWMLRGSILAGVEQILTLLDVEVRRRERDHWAAQHAPVRIAPLVRDALPDWKGTRRRQS